MKFLSTLPFLILVFAGSCHADGDLVLHSKPADLANSLKGRWSADCSNFEGIEIDNTLKAEFTINSNQITINSILKRSKDGAINGYFKSPQDLGRGGMNLDWDNFSTIHRIAVIKIKSENDFHLNWIGFFSNKTKKYQWVNQPNFYANKGNIEFHRCEN
jgi:hypothetical protein